MKPEKKQREFIIAAGIPEGAEGDVLVTEKAEELIITEVEVAAIYYVREARPEELSTDLTFIHVEDRKLRLINRRADLRSRGVGVALRAMEMDRMRKARIRERDEKRKNLESRDGPRT